MKIDLGSFAFGFTFDSCAGNPSWGTSFGQSQPQYYLKEPGCDRVIKGLVYNMVPLCDVAMPLGKGSHFDTCDRHNSVQMVSVFNKVVVNDTTIDYPFILAYIKEDSYSHPGRRSLKYSEKCSYKNGMYLNSVFVDKVREVFGLSKSACWFAYDIDVDPCKQEELKIKVCFVDKHQTINYKDAPERRRAWIPLIEAQEGVGWWSNAVANNDESHETPEEREQRFIKWLSEGDTQNGVGRVLPETAKNYAYALRSYLELDDIFENIKPKNLFEVAVASEFETVFKQIVALPEYENFNVEHGKRRLGAALAAYQKFLECDGAGQAPQAPSEPENIDKLTIALKLFATQRETEPQYDDYARQARAMFKDVDGAKLIAIDWNEFCSKHFNGSQSSAHFRGYDNAAKTALGDWLKSVREDAQDIAHELDRVPKFDGLKSFGTTICMFLMKANPKSFCSFAEQGFNSLVFLGLESKKRFPEVSVESYYHNKELQTQVLAAMEKLGIKNEDDGAADYLTVNEFLWFVHDNEDLIKEKVMSKQMKNVEKNPIKSKRSIADAVEKDELMKRLMAALRTKPFAILAGHSGTGKSRLVRRLAYMTCNDEGLLAEAKDSNAPGNYCMVQVKPNWHDSTDLIGYYSELNKGYHTTQFVEFICKAYAYPETPFFVCLDEMNLAPVEHYFAEYLSAIEGAKKEDGVYLTDPLIPKDAYDTNEIRGKCNFIESDNWLKAHGLTIPKNLFVVGTVNMDETTQQFSRKVLDRAMTILMDEVDFTTMNNAKEPCDEVLLGEDGIKFFLNGETNTKVADTDLLDNLNKVLGNTPFVIAYRFAKEFALYKAAIEKLGQDNASSAVTALDHIVLMKLLPRIHGEREDVKRIFKGKDGNGGLISVVNGGLSEKQMESILKRGGDYLTFWP